MVATREMEKPTKEQNQNVSGKGDNGNSHREMTTAVASPLATQRSQSAGISPWTYDPLRRMREQFDRMFEQVVGNWPMLSESGRQMHWGLATQEDDSNVTVRAEAPGFEPGDFDIQVRGDQLILRAAHQAKSGQNDSGYQEWHQQEFYRSVTLPCGIDHQKVDANYRQGVLTVTLAKTEECKGRRIAVKG